MAVTKTIIKLSNTEAVIRISGVAGDTATIILDSDLLLPLEYLNNDPIQVNIGAVYCAGVKGGYASLIRNNLTILNVANKSLEPTHLLGEPFVPDSINNTSNIVVTITGQQSQVYIYLKKVSGFTSTDSVIDSAFNVMSLFGAGEQGAWYDPSDLTTLFQDSAGTIPVTAVEQPVGLMLDKSRGLALGAELVTNGDFSNGTTGWAGSSGGVLTNTSGQLILTCATTYGIGSTAIATVIGASYKVLFSVAKDTSNNAYFQITPTLGGAPIYEYLTSSGTLSNLQAIFVATTTTSYIKIVNSTAGSIVADNISVKQIAGNHAFQATAGNRPVLSARVNLLTKTEDFSAGVWAKSGAAATIDTITATVGGGSVIQGIPNYASIIKFSVLFKVQKTVGATKFPMFSIYLDGGTATYGHVILNTNTGFATQRSDGGVNNLPTDIVSTDKTTYWELRYNVESRVNNTGGTVTVYPAAGSTGTTFDSASTGSVTIYGVDLRPTNSGALLPPYQRVNTASDYDTVGFPLYLKANGTSSAMSTNSIDFTSTDKMTVVTGVRKLSDAVTAVFIEISPDALTTSGAFAVAGPAAAGTMKYAYWSRGTSAVAIGSTNSEFAAPITIVITGQTSIATPSMSLRLNSNQVAISSSTLGTGNFGNYPLYLFARTGTGLFLNGQFYGAIIRGATTDQTSVIKAEKLMATKTGITF